MAVLAYLNGILDEPGGVCDILVLNSQNDGTGFLGQAGASYWYSGSNGEYLSGSVYEHIKFGSTDPSPDDSDMDVVMDFGFPWNSDYTQTTQFSDYDLFSVLLHEITHGLGVASLSEANGDSAFLPDIKMATFDRYIHSSADGESLWDASATPRFSQAIMTQRLIGQGGFGSLDYRGVFAVAAFGGNPPINTPNPYKPGSSTSHWGVILGPNQPVMLSGIPNGTERRTFLLFELLAFVDLGYNLALGIQPGDVVINEIRYDDTGVDDAEFIELKNTSNRSIDLSEIQIHRVYGTIVTTDTLSAVSLAPGEYYLIGTQNTSLSLVAYDEKISGMGNLGQTGNDGVAISRVSGNILLDVVMYDGAVSFHPSGSTDTGSTGDAAGDSESVSRFPDGVDTDDNAADFVVQGPTPGQSNGTIVATGSVVINELRYNDDSVDNLEFIELRNVGTETIQLATLSMQQINNGVLATSVTLGTGELDPSEYYVLGTSNTDTTAPFTIDAFITIGLQNGVNDGMAVIRSSDGAFVDDVVYNGSTHPAGATDSGNAGTASGDELTLSRVPDGADTNNNSADFSLTPPTIGATNAGVNTLLLRVKDWNLME